MRKRYSSTGLYRCVGAQIILSPFCIKPHLSHKKASCKNAVSRFCIEPDTAHEKRLHAKVLYLEAYLFCVYIQDILKEIKRSHIFKLAGKASALLGGI